jgi:hypothetical protein
VLAAASVFAVFVVPPSLLVGWGYLLARLLLPARFAAFRPWLCPALGLALVGSVGPSAGALGIPLRPIAWPLVALAGAGWVFLLRERGGRKWFRAHLPALVVLLAALVLAASPLVFQGTLTTIGSSIDAISYNVRSEYVQDNPLRIPEVPAGHPWLGWVAAQIALLRVGDVYFLGLSSLVLSRRSFEVFSVIAALAHVHAVFGTYFFARVGLRRSRRVGVLAASFVALSNTLLWPGLDCSFSQAMALAFVPVCLATASALFRRPSPRLAIALGILLSGLVTIYPVFFVLVAFSVGLLGGAAIAFYPGPALRTRRAGALVLAGVVSVAAGPIGTARAVRELGFVGGMLGERGISAVGAGNILVFPPVSELFGFISHAAEAHEVIIGGRGAAVGAVLAALAAAFAVRGLVLGGLVRALAPLSILVTAGGLAVHQRFVVNPPGGYPYGYFKAVTVLAIVLAPLLAAGLAGPPAARRFKGWALVVAGGFLLVSARYVLWTLEYSATTQVLASRELLEAARMAAGYAGERGIEVRVERGPRENWFGYLLRYEKVDFPGGNELHPVSTPPLPLAPTLALIDRNRTPGPEDGIQSDRPTRPVWTGARYRLVEWVDGRLAEWPLVGVDRWSDGYVRATVDRTRKEVSLDVGGARTTHPLPRGQVRTIQLEVASMGGAEFSSPGGEMELAPGAWRIDWDTDCRMPLELGLLRGSVVPGLVSLLDAQTGDPDRCTEIVRSPRGFLEWRGTVANQVLRAEIAFVPPGGEPPSAYRIGVHIGGRQGNRSGLWGVFSLDLPRDGRPHRATLRIDLRARAGLGTIDGASAPIEETNKEIAEGLFDATLALWNLDKGPKQHFTTSVLTFEVDSVGTIGVLAVPTDIRRWWSSH